MSKLSKVTTDELVRELILRHPTVSLYMDEFPKVFIVPTILDPDCTTKKKLIGRLEYQVSDGPPNDRSRSYDEYTFRDAVAAAVKMHAELNT